MTELDIESLIGSKVTFSRVPITLMRRIKDSCLNEFTIKSVKAIIDRELKIKLVITLVELPDVYIYDDCLVMKQELKV